MFGLSVGVCKVCGCTENNACMTEVGPCFWVNEEKDLCSNCVQENDIFQPMHVYHCANCSTTFGIDAYLEDQSSVVCPICHTDNSLNDAGSGYFFLTRNPQQDEQQILPESVNQD
jgi:DNA-directed RNA polymerase subunit RPC12/RpoP